MPEPNASPARTNRWLYVLTIVVVAGLTYGLASLLMNIRERQEEGRQHFFQLVELTEDTIDPEIWKKNFPSQYDGYIRTVDMVRTRHGGSEAFSGVEGAPSKLEQDPRLVRLYSGYAFSIDFREKRGHAYMLSDQDVSKRTKEFKQPGACLHCHSSVVPAYRKEGDGDIWKGFEKLCAMPLAEARTLVTHPVACIDCHDPKTVELRVKRPAFLKGIQVLAESDDPLTHLPSINTWRKSKRETPYDPNTMATRQEMRSFVCAQCHVEYYFKGDGKLLTYPWHKGLKVEQIEGYYDEVGFKDWLHKETGAPVLKAQHPEFEMWNQGVHARSGVSCADCHMAYKREGAVKISDHHVRSPMLNVNRACQTCHRFSEEEIKSRVEAIQGRTRGLLVRAEEALMELFDALKDVKAGGATAEQLKEVYALQRKAQWRLDFVLSENSFGFHAPQESARILGEAIDFARQAQIKVLQLRVKS